MVTIPNDEVILPEDEGDRTDSVATVPAMPVLPEHVPLQAPAPKRESLFEVLIYSSSYGSGVELKQLMATGIGILVERYGPLVESQSVYKVIINDEERGGQAIITRAYKVDWRTDV